MKRISIILCIVVAAVAVFLVVNKTEYSFLAIDNLSASEGEKIKPKALPDVFLNGDYEKVHSQMSKAFRKEVSLAQLKELGEEFNKNITTYIFQSELSFGNGVRRYTWTDASSSKGMAVVFDKDDIIQGMQIMPLSNYPETDKIYTETEFDLPFQGEWFVFWGGANSLVNYHYDYENQRYAYDFIVMNESGSYKGNPTVNKSYFAFGKEYFAPANGTIVTVKNDVEDNEPVGKMNEEQPLGNYVIIDHGNGEYSYLAHFKHQSIIVNEGDEVRQGDLLGLVGNSGNSSEPHIHIHVANSPDPMTSKSIRIKFEGREGFIQGDFVSSIR